MPNWCLTEIRIKGRNKEETKGFYQKVESWMTNYRKTDFGSRWLGNILYNSGVDTPDKEKGEDFHYRCRGEILDLNFSDDEVLIVTSTAWCPMIQMWKAVTDKYLPGAEIKYLAEEPGFDVWITNNPDYSELYLIEVWGDSSWDDLTEEEAKAFDESELCDLEREEQLTQEEVLDILQSLFPEEKKEKLFDRYYDSNFTAIMTLKQWSWCDIEECA